MAPQPIADTQPVTGSKAFIGEAFTAKPLPLKPVTNPVMAPLGGMHSDIFNSDVDNFPAPLGKNSKVLSNSQVTCGNFLSDGKNRLTATCIDHTSKASGLYAIDPKTLAVKGSFTPSGESLLGAYAMVNSKDRIIIGTGEHYILEISRKDSNSASIFKLENRISLKDVIHEKEQLLASAPDKDGRIWFVTGGILNTPYPPTVDYSSIGFVTQEGLKRVFRIQGEIIENGFAIQGNNAFVITDHALYAFGVTKNNKIKTLWREGYDRGSKKKPGTYARGSGASVTMLGDKYIAVTDNADEQVSLLVYKKRKTKKNQLVCKVPLFKKGQSALDVSPIGISLGNQRYSVVLANIYNSPTYDMIGRDINGEFNDLSRMGPGLTRVDVLPLGKGCKKRWTQDLRSTTVSKLSTKTGLIYTYEQDQKLASLGQYVWYFSAIDFRTGKRAFSVRAGAGGLKNNNAMTLALTPDGTVFQGVLGGFLALKDRPQNK